MRFDDSYFQGEEREGFFVEDKMKRAWAAQIEVLEEIDRICSRHNIMYYAGYGTMLGAVRHKGFIPWDDDMDLYMLRDEYERFLSVVQQEMPEDYRLYNMYTDAKYDEIFSRIVNSDKINFADEYLEKYHGCPYVVGIDIFPLDFLPGNEDEKKLQYDLYAFVLTTKYKVGKPDEDIEARLAHIEDLCQVELKRDETLRRQLLMLADKLSCLYRRSESEHVAIIHSNVNGFTAVMRKEWYEDVVRMPFENTSIPVPKNYDDCLRAIYGPDYMTPIRMVAHEYPFYKKQDRILQNALKEK